MRTGERKRERERYEKVSKVVDHDQEVHMIRRFYFLAGFLAQLFWQSFGVLCASSGMATQDSDLSKHVVFSSANKSDSKHF